MRITSVTSTDLFVGEPDNPSQVLRVECDQPGPVVIRVTGDGVHGEGLLPAGQRVAEIGVRATAPIGATIPIQVKAGDASAPGELVIAEPGWTVWMVSHFHYDPVWWNTQSAYDETWDKPGQLGTEFRQDFQKATFDLVRLHLEKARQDPDYTFVLAELDYLKPYWDSHPEDRAYLRHLIDADRVELMGGTYNEPSTNLISAESTIRNLVYGTGFQRDVLGGDPRTAWQLDVFGHDPQFPGLAADAGLDSSSWARGPFHQWGPMMTTHEPGPSGWGDPATMQFPSEFEWLSPSGKGVLTHYQPAHYSAGWHLNTKTSLAEAEEHVYQMLLLLKKVAATRNVLLPVGTDFTPPARWVTEIHRDWNARYCWPRFVCGLPRDFLAAVRGQLASEGRALSPQTRDMNPVYTGKDVSYIDTKQAQRHIEALLSEAETFSTIAATRGADYPHAALDRAWRQLLYGAHHDGITGSESDQVYLDLLAGWREAYDLARGALDGALEYLAAEHAGGDSDPVGEPPPSSRDKRRVVVFNPSSWPRTDLVRTRVTFREPGTRGVTLDDGRVPILLENPETHPDGSLSAVDLVFLATEVPPVGYRAWRVVGSAQPGELGWQPVTDCPTPMIQNSAYRLVVDPRRGGTVSELEDLRCGRTLLQPGRTGNELVVYDEYPAHPGFGEGPWHLLPKGGPVAGSAQSPAESVLVERCALGERVTVTGQVGPVRFTQRLTLWSGVDRVEATTHVDRFTGADQLVRLRWPMAVPGALPVSEVADAAIGRGFAIIDVDSERAPWTLDNPAQNWFALSATARIDLCDPAGARVHSRAVGVAEIILPAGREGDPSTRELALALIRRGVTATCSTDTGPRYGNLAVDSNLPDTRIAVGGPDQNTFTARLLAEAPEGYAAEVARQLAATGRARVMVPASAALTEVWRPNTDLTGDRALAVLIVAGAGEVAALCEDLDGGVIEVRQPARLCQSPDPDLVPYTVGVINRGTPGFAVDTGGAMHLSLLRSCTGWPSGVWIDPPRRSAPDGSAFQQQHWTHGFEYALVAAPGDWRDAGMVSHGYDVNHPLRAVVAGSDGAVRPDSRSFLRVEPAGQVVLSALKPADNPLARGLTPEPGVDRVTLRLYEATGRPTRARVTLWTSVAEIHDVDLMERRREPARDVEVAADGREFHPELAGCGIGQWTLRLPEGREAASSPEPDVSDAASADAEWYARYWLHNAGPAPTGNLPVTVRVEPADLPVTGPVTLTVTVASDLVEEMATGLVELSIAEGWRCEPPVVAYELAPGGHARFAVAVSPPAEPAPGVYWVQARLQHANQTVVDVARLLVATDEPERLSVTGPVGPLRIRPGESAAIEVRLESDAATPITVDAWLISPWQTWGLFPRSRAKVTVEPRGQTTLKLPISVPRNQPPGRWWALLRLAHAGQLHYTEPFEVDVPA